MVINTHIRHKPILLNLEPVLNQFLSFFHAKKLGELGENNGFTGAGGKAHQLSTHTRGILVFDGLEASLLVVAEFHPKRA